MWRRPDLRAILIMLFLIGTFGLNFPIFIATMAVNVFQFIRADSFQYGAGRDFRGWWELVSSGSAVPLPHWRLDTGGSRLLS